MTSCLHSGKRCVSCIDRVPSIRTRLEQHIGQKHHHYILYTLDVNKLVSSPCTRIFFFFSITSFLVIFMFSLLIFRYGRRIIRNGTQSFIERFHLFINDWLVLSSRFFHVQHQIGRRLADNHWLFGRCPSFFGPL